MSATDLNFTKALHHITRILRTLDPGTLDSDGFIRTRVLGSGNSSVRHLQSDSLMDYQNVTTVGIIGAGVAGLATARSLMARDLACTLYERNAVPGGVWSDGYLNFGVQVQKELYEFPDWPLPQDASDFTPGQVIQDYLTGFASEFGILPHIRFNSLVTEISQTNGPGSGWRIRSTQDGELHEDEHDLVVICIGLYSNVPSMPAFPDRDRFEGEVYHNSALKSANQLAGKRVAVVGFGKSATDAAIESARAAASTHIVFRTPHWPIPRNLAGILPFKWGLLHRLNLTLLPPYQSMTAVESAVHSVGKPLVWLYWRLVELLLLFQHRMGSRSGTRVSLVPETPIEIDAFGESTMVPQPAFYRLARNGGIQLHRTSITRFTRTGLALADGTALELDSVIMATGWQTDFSFVAPEIWARMNQEDDGFYLYRHILNPDIPGLVFVGRVASISSILTYCLQAEWLGELITGQIRLPDAADMIQNVNEMKAWKRDWIPFSAARSARLIAHTQHYHDELLRDMGINPLRKTGVFAPLKELIFPYEPRDYATLFSDRGNRVSIS